MSESKSKHPILKTLFIIFLVLAIMATSPYITYIIMRDRHQKEVDDLRQQIELMSQHDEDVEVDTNVLRTELNKLSELATAEMTYACKSDIEEGSVSFVDKAGYTMYYEATVKAGIDVDKIEISNEEKKVVVTLPAARVLGTPDIKDDSIQYYNEKKALFNWKDSNFHDEARRQAKEDLLKHSTTKQLLEFANKYAEEVVKDLLSTITGNKKLIIKHAKAQAENTENITVTIPISNSDAKGKNYNDIVTMFESAGFTNIVTEGLKDIGKISDLYLKENAVKEIAIKGNTKFNKNQSVESDALVVIRYHSK